jgi:hypothetical protein
LGGRDYKGVGFRDELECKRNEKKKRKQIRKQNGEKRKDGEIGNPKLQSQVEVCGEPDAIQEFAGG